MYTAIKLAVAMIVTATMVAGPTKIVADVPITIATTTPTLSYQQKAWLGALEWCESRGTPGAINPKDNDDTPSYGILQFKPGSFRYFSGLYRIATTSIMDPDEQIAIVTEMILRGDVNLHKQFPACTTNIGLPPKNGNI